MRKKFLAAWVAAVMVVAMMPAIALASPTATRTTGIEFTPLDRGPSIPDDNDDRFDGANNLRNLGDLDFHEHEIPTGIGIFHSWETTGSNPRQSAAGLRVEAVRNFEATVTIGQFMLAGSQTNTGFHIDLDYRDTFTAWSGGTANMFPAGGANPRRIAAGSGALPVVRTSGLTEGALSLWAANITGVLTIPQGQMLPGHAQADITWTVMNATP